MNLNKIGWCLRRLIYSLFYKGIHWKGYIGKPIIRSGWHNIVLEKNTRIFPNSRIELYGEYASVKIMSNVSIGQGVHITSGGKLTIGSGTLITGNVVITNIDHSYEITDVPMFDQPYIVKETKIGSNCFIGFGAVIQAGTTLGDNCIVGANSVVRGNFEQGCVIVGVPGRVIKKNLNGQWVSCREKH